MKKKLIWRLGKLPTPSEVSQLVQDKIITYEEAKEILFKEEDEDSRNLPPPKSAHTEELETEIVFLRKLVDKLSEGKTTVITEYINRYPQQTWQWYKPYMFYCTSAINNNELGGATSMMYKSIGEVPSVNSAITMANGASFSDITTF